MPDWEFPGRLKVERMLRRAERFTDIAEQVVTHLPKSKAMRDAVSRVDRDKARVDFVKRYSDLYGMYTETEVVYTDDRTLALFESLSERDKAAFPFDAAMVDWKYYLKDVHSPAVTQSLRELSKRDREKPAVKIREREQPVLAVFDMEGTIITSNVVESYVWTRMADLRARRVARRARRACSRRSRATCRSTGATAATSCGRSSGGTRAPASRASTGWCASHVGEFMLQKASAAAIRRVREHRAAGHRTILITAAAEPFVRPLAPLFDVVIGAELEVRDGRYTGFMSQPPLVGEARAAWLKRYAVAGGRRPEALLRLRGLLQRPAVAAGGGQPRGGLAGRGAVPLRAPPPLADRGVGHVEGHAARALPEAARPDAERALMALALELFRSAPRYLTARAVGDRAPGLVAGPLAPLRLSTRPDPEPRHEGWVRVKPLPGGHLRQRPVHDRGQVELLLLAARVDAVRARPRGRGRAAGRRRRRSAGRQARGDLLGAGLRRARACPSSVRTARRATTAAATASRWAT